ncbi:MAG: hypothetical protein LBO65_09570 [Spirochaetaceae bacterium]|jgi:hypothetical protein|nr:hypothetical protein [Spirochaetaceae bacterium]
MQNLEEYAALHTVQVVSYQAKMPERIGCGCLVLFRDLMFIISVAHILETENSKMAIILHNDPNFINIPNWAPFNPTFSKAYKLRYPLQFVKIIQKFYKLLHIDGNTILEKVVEFTGGIDFVSSAIRLLYMPLHNLPIDSKYYGRRKEFINFEKYILPNKNENYCFYAMTNPHGPETGYKCDETFISDIKYIKTQGFYFLFKLKSHNNDLAGASGAPIFNENGQLISLVVKKHESDNFLFYGINLKKVKLIMHIEANSIKGEEIYE